MKNLAKHFNVKSITRWSFVNHPEWCDDDDYAVISVLVERVTSLNGEVMLKKIIEKQDHVVRKSTKESMAAEACLKMNSIYMDEEVYVGF